MAGLASRFERIARGDVTLGFDPLAKDTAQLAEIPVEAIVLDPDQPRGELGDLTELTDSIREHGIVQPLIVTPLDERRFQLLAGERRLTAARAAGLAHVPAVVRTVAEHRRLELQLIENLHRKDLTAVEEATAYRRLMAEFGLNQQELARRLGKSRTAVNETLRILDLAPSILEAIRTSESISRSLLLEIAKRPHDEQPALWKAARQGTLTVRQVRERKRPTPRALPKRFVIRLPQASVTIAFTTPEATPAKVLRILEEALSAYRTEHTPLAGNPSSA